MATASWGDRDYRPDTREPVEFDAGQDLARPITVAAVVGPRSAPPGPYGSEPPVSAPGPKLAVIGSSLSFVNRAVRSQPQNLYLLQNSINWMAGKLHMLGIPPRTLEFRMVGVSDGQVVASRYMFVGILPACIIALGIGVWWMRRR